MNNCKLLLVILASSINLLLPTPLFSGDTQRINVQLKSAVPLSLPETQALCATLYSKLENNTIYHLSSHGGLPFTCNRANTDEAGVNTLINFTIFRTY